jgi:hypothetical protein
MKHGGELFSINFTKKSGNISWFELFKKKTLSIETDKLAVFIQWQTY